MRILITGVSGQIGTNLALRCLTEGHDVYGIDCRPNTWTTAISQGMCDLTQTNALTGLEQQLKYWGKPDVVVHLAAHAKVHQLVIEPHKAFENISMLQTVLEYCRKYTIPIFFSSSREVYGNIYRLQTTEEDADFNAIASPYAASKLAGETLIYSYARCYQLPYMVFRLSNVYGRFDNDLTRMERLIPLFIHKIQQGQPITVFDGSKVLTFTYIDDCIDGIMRGIECLISKTIYNQTFNIAGGESHTLEQMCHYLMATLNMSVEIQQSAMQIGEVQRYVADITKANRLLNFEPQITLKEGLNKAIAWSHSYQSQSCKKTF